MEQVVITDIAVVCQWENFCQKTSDDRSGFMPFLGYTLLSFQPNQSTNTTKTQEVTDSERMRRL